MSQTLVVKVKKLTPGAKLPKYAHPGRGGDMAADLYASSEAIIPPGAIVSVSTGIAVELPEGYGALVEDRSGLATQGVTTLAGVVDTGYRGEIRIIIANLGKQQAHIHVGDRVAQLRLTRRYEASFELADQLSATLRGEQGEWNFPDSPLRGAFARHSIYESLTGWQSFEPALLNVEQMNIDDLWRIAAEIPAEWYEHDSEAITRLIETLHERRSHIRELITSFRNSTRNPFPNWK